MAATAPSTDQLPLLHHSATEPSSNPPPFSPLPPDYYAPTQAEREARPRSRTSPQRSVRFQSPPADPPRSAPDNHSLLPPYSPRKHRNQYKGHKSEDEYLTAMRAWAEEKMMMQPGEKSVLPGFYGKETMEECIAKNPRLREGRGKKERKAGERGEGRRLREAVVKGEGEVVVEGRDGEEGGAVEPRRRKSSFGQWLSRKRTD